MCNQSDVDADAVAFSTAHFGAGIGKIFLDDVGCTGSEHRLIDCSRASSSSLCYRGHSEDAGVRCQLKGLLAFTSSYHTQTFVDNRLFIHKYRGPTCSH